MSGTYDVTSKELIEAGPADWVGYLGRPTDPARVSVIDADVSAVTAMADKVIRVADGPPWVLHLEFQSAHEAGLPRRLLRYNALLQERHGCPVASALVLLRREANPADVTGEFVTAAPVGPAWPFRYTVVRVWREPVEPLLTGGLALLPLAPIADVPQADVPGVIARMKDRLGREAPRPAQGTLWAATQLLMGLRYDAALIEVLLAGVRQMEESTTYQAILRRGERTGEANEARRLIVRLGTRRFNGPPPAAVAAALDAITDLGPLEALADRVLDAAGWDDLLTVS